MRFFFLVVPFALFALGPAVRVECLPGETCVLTQEVPEERSPGEVTRLVQNCIKCHEDVHSEWSTSLHAKSWTDPVFQAAIADLKPEQVNACARCHAPRSLFHSGLGKLPLARTHDRDMGVNCVTCHLLGNEYHGPFESKGHGGVEATPEFRTPVLCLSCHGQPEARKEHDQGTSFLAAKGSEPQKSCQSCHMPEITRKLVTNARIKEKFLIGEQAVRVHSFTGPRRGDKAEGCADLTLTLNEQGLRLSILPKTGHGLPTSEAREVILDVVQSDADGKELKKDTKTYRFLDGTALPPGRPTEVLLPLEANTQSARATLRLVLLPVGGRGESIVQPIADSVVRR